MIENQVKVKDSRFDFSRDVLEGLNASPKSLKSCYLYDEKGDRLFQAKMAMSEYYLTNCEYEIFSKYKDDIIDILTQGSESLNLIELGAGDGYKTKILLKDYGQNLGNTVNIIYIPVDISVNILKELKDNFLLSCPNLPINPLAGDYIWALKEVAKSENQGRKAVFFIGSTIGNMLPLKCEQLLYEVASCLNSGDLMLIGFDLIKSPQTIIDAYILSPDKALSKNILERINNELEGNFDLDNFEHYFSYNPMNGLGETFLISKKEQKVTIEACESEVFFQLWEPIHISPHQKYDTKYIKQLLLEKLVTSFIPPKFN